MHYKVVLQGRTLGGAEVVAVKREFLRVTGLPASFADHLFDGMPQVIKRQVSQPDAERIAATLRAIGAAATVERELTAAEETGAEGIRIVATPLSGPPSIIPGMMPAPQQAPPSRRARALGALREKLPLVGGSVAVIAVAILAAPYVEDLVNALRPPKPVAPAAAPRTALAATEAAAAATPLNPTLVHGPWRCVDQNRGTPDYWTYDADGALVHHGNVFKETPAAAPAPPMTWKIEGRRLVHAGPQAPVTYAIADLTLMRLRYGNDKGLDIQCRRP